MDPRGGVAAAVRHCSSGPAGNPVSGLQQEVEQNVQNTEAREDDFRRWATRIQCNFKHRVLWNLLHHLHEYPIVLVGAEEDPLSSRCA